MSYDPRMSSLLDRPAIRKQVHLVTVEDYHAFGDAGFLNEDVELLQGVIVNKMSKSPLHDIVLRLLARKLNRALPETYDVRVESPLTFDESEPEPDVSVVKWEPKVRATSHPKTALLVAEVAVTSIAVDEEKADIYAAAGIPEYWLIRPEARELDLFREPSPTGYQSRTTLRDGDTLRALELPEIAFAVSDIFPPL